MRQLSVQRSCLASAVLLACVACASTPTKRLPSGPPADDPSKLGPGDAFEVSVYGEEDLSGKHRIAEDGTIDFPLVGRIAVGGKAPGEIAGVIQSELKQKQILREPHVSVYLLEQSSKQITVMGAVSKPGSYPLTPGMTIVQAISAAGGLAAIASGNNTIVTRKVSGELQRFRVGVERISEGREEDFPVQGGDIVFVPSRIF